METVMEGGFRCRMLGPLFFTLLVVSESLHFTSGTGERQKCNCYNRCEENFTANSVNYEQTKAACQTGCRFYCLSLHTSSGINPTLTYSQSKKGCLTSCSESYMNPVELEACNYGCLSVKLTEPCDPTEHDIPQITYSIFIEESDMLIHAGDPEPDDALIDPGLRKQFEKTLGTLLDSKPKLPEIHFRNLPISNKESQGEHPRGTFKCPKFYGLDAKLEFRNGKITLSDLFFLFSVLAFALICFTVSRSLEKQRKLWKQVLTNVIQSKSLTKMMENSAASEPLLNDDRLEKGETKDGAIQQLEPTYLPAENLHDKFEGMTLVFYDDEDAGGGGRVKSNESNNDPKTLKV